MAERYLIIGNGAAGATAAETLRAHAPQAEIAIVSAEPYPMYSRPGLAYVVSGEIPLERVIARTAEWYAAQRIARIDGRAVRLHAAAHAIELADGRRLPYDRLLIAVGARAVSAPYPGHDLQGVVFLDTYDDTAELLRLARARSWRRRRAVVIGGGITALELAEGLAHLGLETHYFLRGRRLWPRVFNDAEAQLVVEKMQAHGVTVHPETEIAAVEGDRRGRVQAVRLANSGDRFPCQMVGVGIGVRPQVDWLRGSGLDIDKGIRVDDCLQTNLPDVFAAGDCAQVYDPAVGRHLLDILWPTAVAQGRLAARNMLGDHRPYRKDAPFNAALLFGLHITVIGQVNPTPAEGDGLDEAQSWSRGSSEAWYTFPRHYQSAWSGTGDGSLRLITAENRLVGAVVLGEQTAADALRGLIECGQDIAPLQPALSAERAELQAAILRLWKQGQTCDV